MKEGSIRGDFEDAQEEGDQRGTGEAERGGGGQARGEQQHNDLEHIDRHNQSIQVAQMQT